METTQIHTALDQALAHDDPPHRKFLLLKVARMAGISDPTLKQESCAAIEQKIRNAVNGSR